MTPLEHLPTHTRCLMAVNMYPDPEVRRNRGYLGYDSSALSPRDLQASFPSSSSTMVDLSQPAHADALAGLDPSSPRRIIGVRAAKPVNPLFPTFPPPGSADPRCYRIASNYARSSTSIPGILGSGVRRPGSTDSYALSRPLLPHIGEGVPPKAPRSLTSAPWIFLGVAKPAVLEPWKGELTLGDIQI